MGKASSPGASGLSTSNVNGDMYIADGDYIKDIEVNDLRNRYTLTKGSTQKTVNTLVISTDNPRPYKQEALFPSWIKSSEFPWRELKAYLAHIAHCNPSLASANLKCVTSRSKRRLGPVRYTYINFNLHSESSSV